MRDGKVTVDGLSIFGHVMEGLAYVRIRRHDGLGTVFIDVRNYVMQSAVDDLAGPLHSAPVLLAACYIRATDNLFQEILHAGHEVWVVLELEEYVEQWLFVSMAWVIVLRIEDACDEEKLDERSCLGL